MHSDQDAKVFLRKIMNTISVVLLWTILHIMIGLYVGLALIDGKPIWINIVYYITFAGTLVTLIIILKRIWK